MRYVDHHSQSIELANYILAEVGKPAVHRLEWFMPSRRVRPRRVEVVRERQIGGALLVKLAQDVQ